jgi:Tol biopolymer transport system component
MKVQRLFLLVILLTIPAGIAAQDMFPVRQLTSGPGQNGFASWAPDSKSMVHQISTWNDTPGRNGLWIVSPDGREAKQIFKGIAEHPKWSPDGRNIVFDADTGSSIKMIPSIGGDAEHFLPDSIQIVNGGLPCWSPSGSEIAFLERSGLSLCVYNMKTGSVRSIFHKEGMIPLPGCWTKDGNYIMVALMEISTRKSTIWKISANGKTKTQVYAHLHNVYRHLALSPDGSLLIYAVLKGRYLGLWIMPSNGGRSLPFAVTENSDNESAAWSPDGKTVAFTSTRSGNFDIWLMDVNIDKIKQELQINK